MNKRLRIISITIGVIVGTSIVASASTKDLIDANNKKIEQYKEEQKSLDAEKLTIDFELEELLSKLQSKQDEIDVVQGEVDVLQSEIDSLQKNIDEAMLKISATENNIVNVEKSYDKTAKEQEIQEKLLSERLKRNYINNTYNELIGILLDSESLSDVLFKAKYINDILNMDKNTINSIAEKKDELVKLQEKLEREKHNLESSKVSLEYQQKELQSKQNIILEKKSVLDLEFNELSLIEQEKQSKIAAIQNSKFNIDSQIEDLTSENAKLTRDMENASSGSFDSDAVTSNFINPTTGRFTSMFGPRIHPITKKQSNHTGVDIANSFGTTIKASDGGKVVKASYYGAYGNCIIIDHGNGYSTMYAHLQKFNVSVGDMVNQGQKIGEMGTTGMSTGPHLHFEVWKNKVPQNPMNYISK